MGGSGSEGPVSTPRHPHRDWRKALVTLHSGRSCRDTPAPLCSTAGTGPARHRGGQREKWGREDIGQHPEMSAPFPSPSTAGRTGTHLCLHHGRPLRPQGLHRLEHVHHPLVAHPLQHDAERDEDACAPDPSAAQGEQEGQLETHWPQRGLPSLPRSLEWCQCPQLVDHGTCSVGPGEAEGTLPRRAALSAPWHPLILPLSAAAVAPQPAQRFVHGAMHQNEQALGSSHHLAEMLPMINIHPRTLPSPHPLLASCRGDVKCVGAAGLSEAGASPRALC